MGLGKDPSRKWYAVRKGRDGCRGVFQSWSETESVVKGVSGALFKSFGSQSEAESWLGGGGTVHSSTLPHKRERMEPSVLAQDTTACNKQKWYAVRRGRDGARGVFGSWKETAPLVTRVSGAVFKAFRCRATAEIWLSQVLTHGHSLSNSEPGGRSDDALISGVPRAIAGGSSLRAHIRLSQDDDVLRVLPVQSSESQGTAPRDAALSAGQEVRVPNPVPAPAQPADLPASPPDSATLMLGGVPVAFPYKSPYPSQIQVMSQVIRSLKTQRHGMLESPTGTGKTLALLCASLAWHRAQGESPRHCKIFYLTRTHSQVSQISREFRKIESIYGVRMTILGSRERYCIHPVVSQLPPGQMGEHCSAISKTSRKNSYLKRYQDGEIDRKQYESECCTLKSSGGEMDGAWDIEDLVTTGNATNSCPWHWSREMLGDATLVICPYQYVLDPDIADAMHITDLLPSSVFIFDEAHNIDDQAKEAGSCVVTLKDLVLLAAQTNREGVGGAYVDLKRILVKIMKPIEKIQSVYKAQVLHAQQRKVSPPLEPAFHRFGSRPGQFFEDFMKMIGWTLCRMEGIVNVLREVHRTEVQAAEFDEQVIRHYSASAAFRNLLRFAEIMSVPAYRTCFVATTSIDEVEGLNAQCLYPGLAIRHLTKARGMILTSGTLHPLDAFQGELGMEFPITCQAPHVLSERQAIAVAPRNGPGATPLKGTYEHRKSSEYKDAVGQSILQLSAVQPHGVLVFFPSFSMLEEMELRWKESGLFDQLEASRNVFKEPRDKNELANVMRSFKKGISDVTEDLVLNAASRRKGSMLMAVCRGKVSEGIDFKDNMCRMVILVGIPYPPLFSPTIRAKMKFNDALCGSAALRKHITGKDISLIRGDRWYSQGAFRALNQALGRVVRHSDDFGSIVLLDSRFQSHSSEGNLSGWVRGRVVRCKEPLAGGFGEFYQANGDLQMKANMHPPTEEKATVTSKEVGRKRAEALDLGLALPGDSQPDGASVAFKTEGLDGANVDSTLAMRHAGNIRTETPSGPGGDRSEESGADTMDGLDDLVEGLFGDGSLNVQSEESLEFVKLEEFDEVKLEEFDEVKLEELDEEIEDNHCPDRHEDTTGNDDSVTGVRMRYMKDEGSDDHAGGGDDSGSSTESLGSVKEEACSANGDDAKAICLNPLSSQYRSAPDQYMNDDEVTQPCSLDGAENMSITPSQARAVPWLSTLATEELGIPVKRARVSSLHDSEHFLLRPDGGY